MSESTGIEGWETVVGLEVHVELATETKLFCGCRNDFGSEPNTNVCPVCLGLPGSLPVLNRTAVEYAMRLGRALGCRVEPSTFARKNYFYPDMPKDYQVSQYDLPVNLDGVLELPDGFRVGIERAHIEEDTGKSTHVGGGGRIHDAAHSLVDYNRAGVPLVEIVSRPDVRTADQARAYANELRGILLATGVSDARMEEGSMRVDANVSVRRDRRRDPRHPGRGQEPELASGPSAGPSTTRPAGRSTCSRPGTGSCRRPGTGTRRTGAPTPCAPRRRPTTTGTSPSPTSSRSCPIRTGSTASTPSSRPCRRPVGRCWPEPPG